MNDKVYAHLRKRYHEVYSVAPNTLHNRYLDALYKKIGFSLKTFPFKLFVPIAVLCGIAAYVVSQGLTIKLVSLLQYGF